MSALTPFAIDPDALPNVEAMTALLDAAALGGADDAYIDLWLSFSEAADLRVGLTWGDVWPSIVVGRADTNTEVERMAALFDHIRFNGKRRKLLARLIGDSEGTRPGVEYDDIGAAVAKVVSTYLTAEGRILITPSGEITEGQGVPHSYLRGDDLHDAEIEAASKAYLTATCCPRAIPVIRAVVETLGTQTANGWIELQSESVGLEAAFSAWKAAQWAINGCTDETVCHAADYAIMDFCEVLILQHSSGGRRAAEALVWVVVQHSDITVAQAKAVADEDLNALDACDPSFDVRTLSKALRALRQETAHG